MKPRFCDCVKTKLQMMFDRPALVDQFTTALGFVD